MAVNQDLKLVIPVQQGEDGEVSVYFYHSPISREVFEANYRVIAATKAAIFSKGNAFAADVGPQIAALRLVDEGRRDAAERAEFDKDGNIKDGGVKALLSEIKRLTVIFGPGTNGWDTLPIDAAIQRGVIDADDWREAESAIIFFTSAYAMAPRSARQKTGMALAGVMNAQTTFSTPSEFAASLQKLTPAAPSEVKAESSVPS